MLLNACSMMLSHFRQSCSGRNMVLSGARAEGRLQHDEKDVAREAVANDTFNAKWMWPAARLSSPSRTSLGRRFVLDNWECVWRVLETLVVRRAWARWSRRDKRRSAFHERACHGLSVRLSCCTRGRQKSSRAQSECHCHGEFHDPGAFVGSGLLTMTQAHAVQHPRAARHPRGEFRL